MELATRVQFPLLPLANTVTDTIQAAYVQAAMRGE